MIRSTMTASALSLMVAAGAAHGAIVWEQEYLPSNGLPSAQNANWILNNGSSAGTTSIVTGGYNGQDTLLVNNPTASTGHILWDFGGAGSGWNSTSATGTTLEFVARAARDDGSTWGSQILWTGGTEGKGHGLKVVHVNNGGVRIDSQQTGSNFAFVDFQVWNHWRLVIDPDGKSSLYMNDNETPVWISPADHGSGGGSYLQFGDGGSGGVGGTLEIAFIRWTNSEAVHGAPIPVPEPASFGLALLGGAALLSRRRR